MSHTTQVPQVTTSTSAISIRPASPVPPNVDMRIHALALNDESQRPGIKRLSSHDAGPTDQLKKVFSTRSIFESSTLTADCCIKPSQMWGYLLYLSQQYPFLAIPKTSSFLEITDNQENVQETIRAYLAQEFDLGMDHTLIAFPLYHGNKQWTTVLVDFFHTTIYHFDSMGQKSPHLEHIRDALSHFRPPAQNYSLQDTQNECVQKDTFNDGVFSLLWIHVLCQLYNPQKCVDLLLIDTIISPLYGKTLYSNREKIRRQLEALEETIEAAFKEAGLELSALAHRAINGNTQDQVLCELYSLIIRGDREVWLQSIRTAPHEYRAAAGNTTLAADSVRV